jgi:hypothetical protein
MQSDGVTPVFISQRSTLSIANIRRGGETTPMHLLALRASKGSAAHGGDAYSLDLSTTKPSFRTPKRRCSSRSME